MEDSVAVDQAVISSTVLDLPEHRKQAINACLRQGVMPLAMEHLPASPLDAIRESLRLVDDASIYIGIFGHRYGYIPNGHPISLTEMEFDRAVERGIPRLIFLMSDDHLMRASDVDTGPELQRLRRFKDKVRREYVVAQFRSPEDLRAELISSLSHLRTRTATIHHVSAISAPPLAYVAHPYTLLSTGELVGRESEIKFLTDWAVGTKAAGPASVLNVVAIGGMGKSALAWKWFNDIGPNKIRPLAGRIWWSFYESDASFENFVIRALAYVSRQPQDCVAQFSSSEREQMLLDHLRNSPFLVVLDGLERILNAYGRIDAARLQEADLDQITGNFVSGAAGLDEIARAFQSKHWLRKTIDPRAGNFLRKLTVSCRTKTLITTRLYPSELQTETGEEAPGARALFLRGLNDKDAVGLWRRFRVSGSRNTLIPLFNSVENYPLVITALAGEVAGDRRANGNFEVWLEHHANFDPTGLPLIQRTSHVLSFALRGISSESRKVLATLSGFRMPADYPTLSSLLVGPDKAFSSDVSLDVALTELEDRGLLGWDQRANRYDLHPIVRSIAWRQLGPIGQRLIYENLEMYFGVFPVLDQMHIQSLDDLAAAVELYNALVGLGNFEGAWQLFNLHLYVPMLVQLGQCRRGAELLEALFPKGTEEAPALSPPISSKVTHALAYAYHYAGRERLAGQLWERVGHQANEAVSLLDQGRTYSAERLCHRCLRGEWSTGAAMDHVLYILAGIQASKARFADAATIFRKAIVGLQRLEQPNELDIFAYSEAVGTYLALGRCEDAAAFADRAVYLAKTRSLERPLSVALRSQASIRMDKGDTLAAEELLHESIRRARGIDYAGGEIGAVLDLAGLYQKTGLRAMATELLEDIADGIERGPFGFEKARACNLRAQLSESEGDMVGAHRWALEAFQAAWGEGPAFACVRQLELADTLLIRLGCERPTWTFTWPEPLAIEEAPSYRKILDDSE